MLVDTSVWINHFRRSNDELDYLLVEGHVMTHPFVIGEIACGSMRDRKEVLRLFEALPLTPVASHGEVLEFVDRARLHGSGLGWIDVHLLASAKLAHVPLWSADRGLREAAIRLGLAG
jgi:predicted nucleic acid-binding protein